eukprot:TRINITY_DN12910_c0_g1_i1.p1 TRINITY_DN12910_c0_g1~~TRINITY_DN12910_c0_g1_i1.p1  ORF type:complete len:328 (-),score=67.61 TRINITY_DN12910_c0_g1_i1:52-1035(-)
MTHDKKRKRSLDSSEYTSSKRKTTTALSEGAPRHQIDSNTYMFRASRAIQLTMKPRSNVTIAVEKWCPENFEGSDHKWVPHSIPQVRQGSLFTHVRLEGPAAKHLRLLEENYEAGIFKFSIQGEAPQSVEKHGQIKTFAGYHFTIKGTTSESAKVADIYVFTKTNHVAAGPQVIDFTTAESRKDRLPSDEEKTFNSAAALEREAEEESEQDEEEDEDEFETEDDAEEEEVQSLYCVPATPVASWPSPSVIQVVRDEDDMEEETDRRLFVDVLSMDDEISEALLNKVESSRRNEEPLSTTSEESSQNNFDVDSLLDFGVVEEFCKPVR